MPDVAEVVWGLVSLLLVLVVAAVVVSLVLLATRESRKARDRDEALHRMEARLDRLEQGEDIGNDR